MATSGCPGRRSHVSTSAVKPDVLVPSSALQKSRAPAWPQACRRRYARTPARKRLLPRRCSLMRRIAALLSYVMSSNRSSASSGVRTRITTGWAVRSASRRNASSVSRTWRRHTPHAGLNSSTIFTAMYVAKLSLSHASFHHVIVTRLPNHWCATSCATESKISWRLSADACVGSHARSVMRYVMHPAFSIPAASKSGRPMPSSLANG